MWRSFHFLNLTQFLGVLNENIFKLLIIYFLITAQGKDAAAHILSTASIVFILPFLLFSALGGTLADKFCKRSIFISMKIIEFTALSFSLVALYFSSSFGLYFLLFILGIQGAIFGPSKFSIIPDLVEKSLVPRANGLLSAATFIAVILGTFLASLLTDLTNKNFYLVALFTMGIAILGLITSFFISKTPVNGSKTKTSYFFLLEIYRSLSFSKKIPYLLPAIAGSAFFLFLGTFVQLNIIPFSMESLGLSETGGGYIFVFTALGIAFGSYLGGRLSKNGSLGLAGIMGFVISALLFLLAIFSKNVYIDVSLLILLGICGGIFLVPLDAFIQTESPDKKRGQIVAASSFLSFLSAIIASFFLYLLSKLSLNAKESFAVFALITFVFTYFFTVKTKEFFFSYLAKAVVKRLHISIKLPSESPQILFLETKKPFVALALFSIYKNLQIVKRRRFILPYFDNFHTLSEITSLKNCKSPILVYGIVSEEIDKKNLSSSKRYKVLIEKRERGFEIVLLTF